MAHAKRNIGARDGTSGGRDVAGGGDASGRNHSKPGNAYRQPAEAERITRALGGHWYGSYGVACCPAHDNRDTPALSLTNGRNGGLLAHCFAGCAFGEIVAALRQRGLLDSSGDKPQPPGGTARLRRARRNDRRPDRLATAALIWHGAEPITGTLAERYLRSRAVEAPLPDSLRFAPALKHPAGKRLPAMVATVQTAPGGEAVGVHRTFLAPDGGKAPVEPARMMLGPCAGGAVRLSEGAGPLVVCEGIETGLSLLDSLDGSPRVWAALSTSGARRLVLPEPAGALIVAPDGDVAGRMAAKALAERAERAGWTVTLMDPPDGMDWNDVARGAKHGL